MSWNFTFYIVCFDKHERKPVFMCTEQFLVFVCSNCLTCQVKADIVSVVFLRFQFLCKTKFYFQLYEFIFSLVDNQVRRSSFCWFFHFPPWQFTGIQWGSAEGVSWRVCRLERMANPSQHIWHSVHWCLIYGDRISQTNTTIH